MSVITFQGNSVQTNGDLPNPGSKAPAFTLTKIDLSDISLHDLLGQPVLLNIFPSIDTGVCALSVKKFNNEASKVPDAQILCVSMDLPFAQKRFCGAEGIDSVMPVSTFRHPEFAENYGIKIMGGKLAGLLSRAIVIIDRAGNITYTEQVRDIAHEPDYEAALSALIG